MRERNNSVTWLVSGAESSGLGSPYSTAPLPHCLPSPRHLCPFPLVFWDSKEWRHRALLEYLLCASHDEGPIQPSPGLWERGGDRGSGEGWGLAQVLKLISRHLPFVNPQHPRREDKAILMLGSSQLLSTRDPSEPLWLGSGQGS